MMINSMKLIIEMLLNALNEYGQSWKSDFPSFRACTFFTQLWDFVALRRFQESLLLSEIARKLYEYECLLYRLVQKHNFKLKSQITNHVPFERGVGSLKSFIFSHFYRTHVYMGSNLWVLTTGVSNKLQEVEIQNWLKSKKNEKPKLA